MGKRSRALAILVSGVIAAGLLAACGESTLVPSSSAKSEDDGTAAVSGAVSGDLLVWEHELSMEEPLTALIEGFEKKYPDVTVEYEIKSDGDYYSLLQTAVQSGDGPDLFWTNGTATTNLADFVANDAVADLSGKIDYSFMSEGAMNLATIEGKQYSVPWMTLDTRAVFYNKDLFEENGWKLPKTFSEFEALLQTIKEDGYTPISLAYDPWQELFAYEPIMAAYDPEYVTKLADNSAKATDQPAADALKKMIEWSDAGYFGDNWFGVTKSDAQTLGFTSGKAAMEIAGSWELSTIRMNNPDLNLGAFEIPSEKGVTGLVGTNANGFSINSSTQNMDAALAFADYCASKEGQTLWIQAIGAIPATTEIEATDPVAGEITESGAGNQYRSWQNVLAVETSTGEASNIWNRDFNKVFSKEISVDDFMTEIAENMK